MSRVERWMDWWSRREPRERWLLAVAAVLVAGLVYWYGLLQPLRQWRDESRQRHVLALARESSLQSRLQAIASLQERDAAAVTASELPPLLQRTAAQAGLAIGPPVALADGRVSVDADDVASSAVLAWLDLLRHRHATGPEQVTIEPAASGVRVHLVFVAER